jgi:hypothetical protein
MKKATFMGLIISILILAASSSWGPLERLAAADPGVRGGHAGSFHGGGRGFGSGGGGHFRGGGHGGGHFRGGVWIGPGWGLWDPFFPYYPYYPYYAPPTVVVPQQPETYIQQPAPQQAEPSYWYYCRNPQGYYPYVKSCPGGWLKVVPDQAAPAGEDQDQVEPAD